MLGGLLLITRGESQLFPTPQLVTTGPPIHLQSTFRLDNPIRLFANVVRVFAKDCDVSQSPTGTPIRVRLDRSLADEEYTLTVGNTIDIAASTPTGAANEPSPSP